MASDSALGPRPEDAALAAVADAVEERGFAAEIWDAGWRLAYLSSDYARVSNAGRDSAWEALAADATFPNPNGYNDRKALLIIRQTLEDGSKEAMVAEHGTDMIHLAQRREQGALITDMQYRFGGSLAKVMAKRIVLEKRGDDIALFVSLEGEPMHQFGPPITLHFDAPFYVGIGFCSHLPDKSDTAVLSHVLLENAAGQVH